MAKQYSEKVLRFGRVAIFAHWAHTVTFFVLALTGMMIYFDFLDFLLPFMGGIQGARIIHRVFAVGFMVFPLLALFANFKGFLGWMNEVTTWGKNDVGFLSKFPREFFGLHVEFPPQGRFNAGEKINSLLQVFGCTILGLSGIVIWFPQFFPTFIVRLGYPLHDLSFILTFTAALGHTYLALGHPATNHAINGMTKGYIDAEFAKTHYPKWYEKVQKGEV